MPNNISASERVQAAYRQLSLAATSLNTASDELSETISELDAALKKLNLGISSWVEITSNSDQDGNYWSRELGYAKFNNRWGISLRKVWGNLNPDDRAEESWLFNDAPRWMRIEGIGKIPELLEGLTKQADNTTKKIKKKTIEAKELAAAITEAPVNSEDARRK